MKKKYGLICILVAICLGILNWQRSDFRKLEKEVAAARISLANPASSTDSQNSAASSNQEAVINAADITREDQIKETVDRLLNLPLKPEGDNIASYFRNLGGLLEFLKNQTREKLFLILNELNRRKTEGRDARDVFQFLLMVLSSVEPAETIAFINEHFSEESNKAIQLRMIAFSALAEADPEKAMALVKTQSWENAQIRAMVEMKIIQSLGRQDLRRALDYYQTITTRPEMKFHIMAQVTESPKGREQAWQILNDGDLGSDLRNDLSSGLLAAIYKESGLPGVDKALPRLKFANAGDRDEVLGKIAEMGIWNNPQETMPWIQRNISVGKQLDLIPESVKKWATKDFAAAGNWLREQDPSPVKNAAIETYASTVAKLDPRTALEWSDEISEDESRSETRRKVLERWHQAEPLAAKEWVVDQGLDPKDWLPESGAEKNSVSGE